MNLAVGLYSSTPAPDRRWQVNGTNSYTFGSQHSRKTHLGDAIQNFIYSDLMQEYSKLTARKIQLYFACNYLYDKGKSHPQVVEILSEYEPDIDLLSSIADAAGVDKWRKIFNEAQRLTSLGKNYEEIFSEVKSMETDNEIVYFICNFWYVVQESYAENIIESRTNIKEGIQGFVVCTIGLIAVFYLNASLLSKIVWSLAVMATLFIWFYGVYQRKLAKRLKKILDEDYIKLNKLI